MMNKFKFLRVSIFGMRYHHRHRVYYHRGTLSSSHNVPPGQGRPSRQVLPSVVSPCSTRWCTSRRSPLLQQLQLIFMTNFNSVVTKKCQENHESQERRERQEQEGKEAQEKKNILGWQKYQFFRNLLFFFRTLINCQCNVYQGKSPQNGTVISGGCQNKVTSFWWLFWAFWDDW